MKNSLGNPTALDILRYRYHHGTNLGSVYVLERWMTPGRFSKSATGSSELEAVRAWVDELGEDATKAMFERAWGTALSDHDIDWLKNEAKCTSIRLPIGYYQLPGSEFTRNTHFEAYSHVYASAWTSICTLISRLRARSIGVLLDLHALPGGANAQAHSGTDSGVARFFSSRANRQLGVRCCAFIAQEAKNGLDLVGIQVVNEAAWESQHMYEWYDDCIAAVSAIDSSLPVVVSDAWNLDQAVTYALSKNTPRATNPTSPVIIDTHCYWAFDRRDKTKSPQEIIAEVDIKLNQLNGREGSVFDRGAVQIIIGEYCNVMSEESWSKAGRDSRQHLVHRFGAAQSRRYQQRAGGAYFWSLKMDWMPGGEWGFKAQASSDPSTGKSALVPPPHFLMSGDHDIGQRLQRARHRCNELMAAAIKRHIAHWDHVAPGAPFEHWRFGNGWKTGYQDAYQFFEGHPSEAIAQGNKIGNLELWVLKRLKEGDRDKFEWEFEQGLRRGVHDFNAVVEI